MICLYLYCKYIHMHVYMYTVLKILWHVLFSSTACVACPRAVQHWAVCVSCIFNLCMSIGRVCRSGSAGWFIRMWRCWGSDKTTESTTQLFQLLNCNSFRLWDIHCHPATVQHELCVIGTFIEVGLFDSALYLICRLSASFWLQQIVL